jgi:DNA-binding beta-propeller fold protein YncE
MDATGAGSTVALASFGARTVAFVADEDSRALHVVDVDSGEVLSTTRLSGRPGQLLALADGRVVVAIRDTSKLAVFEMGDVTAPPALRCETAAPPDPVGLARSERELLVTGAWGAKLARLALSDMRTVRVHDVGREPRAVVVSGDGTRAFVSHAVGGHASVVDLSAGVVATANLEGIHDHEIDEFQRSVKEKLAAQPSEERRKFILAAELKEFVESRGDARQRFARTSCQGFALARSTAPAGRILAPQVLVDPGSPEQRTVGYGAEHTLTEVPSVAVIDEGTGHAMPTSLRITHVGIHDESAEHCMLPRAAAVDARTSSLLVTCLGSDRVVAYDAAAPDPSSARRRSWRVPAGPTGLAIDEHEHRAVVFSQFDRVLTVVPLAGPDLEPEEGAGERGLRRIELPADPEHELSVAAMLGRSLFHATGDRRIARDGRACASCHPDGRDDGLVWATPNGPRRTKMLSGTLAATAPYSWDGDAARLHDHLQDTFDRLGGAGGVRSVELKALLAYVESLPAPPLLAQDPAKVERGRAIFASKQAGCAGCHQGGELTDNRQHDVKSRVHADRHDAFNTPTLKYLVGRAPYFHDGRYRTLRDLLEGSDGAMGHTRHLDDPDLDALEAFLASL